MKIHKLLQTLSGLWHSPTVPVRILGSLTVDITTTSSRAGAKIRQPEIGGSSFRTFWALRKLIRPDERQRVDLKVLGKVCERGSPSVWNHLLEFLERSEYFTEFREHLVEAKGWEVPASIIVQYPDGTQERYQQADSVPWDETDLQQLGDDKPGILYLSGGWREPVLDSICEAVAKLKKKGWVLALHTGRVSFEDEAKVAFIRRVLRHLDILFTPPTTLLRLDSRRPAQSEFFRKHASSALEFVAAGQLRLEHQPPVVILHEDEGFLKFEMLLDSGSYFRAPPGLPLVEPVLVPPGLRSTFVAAFLLQLLRNSISDGGDPVEVFKTCLVEAHDLTLDLHKEQFQVQKGRVLAVGSWPVSRSPSRWRPPRDEGKLLRLLLANYKRKNKKELEVEDVPDSVKDLLWELEGAKGRKYTVRELWDRGITDYYIKQVLKSCGILESSQRGGRRAKVQLTGEACKVLQ